MAKFCTACGKPVQPDWNACTYCGHRIYHELKQISQISAVQKPSVKTRKLIEAAVETPSEQVSPFKMEGVRRKRLKRSQITAIIIGVNVILAAIIIPLVSIAVYNYNHPERRVQFYINNGMTSTSYTVKTSRSTLNSYVYKPHPLHVHWDPNYTASIIESYCTPDEEEIIQIARDISLKCIDSNDSEEVINALLSFTQAIGYKSDNIDLAKYPLETIFRQGDCEDLSVLFGSLVVTLGYNAIIVILDVYDETRRQWFGHAGVGVNLSFTPTAHLSYPPSHSFNIDSYEYWICETTAQGWMIGQLPTSDLAYYLMEGYAFIN